MLLHFGYTDSLSGSLDLGGLQHHDGTTFARRDGSVLVAMDRYRLDRLMLMCVEKQCNAKASTW
jgi:hypothetical protein